MKTKAKSEPAKAKPAHDSLMDDLAQSYNLGRALLITTENLKKDNDRLKAENEELLYALKAMREFKDWSACKDLIEKAIAKAEGK